MQTIYTILYCTATFFAGATVMALYYERSITRGRKEIERLSDLLYRARLKSDSWRDIANTTARDLQSLRKQLQPRDPRTGKMMPKAHAHAR